MSNDSHLFKAALELAKAINESVDKELPVRLAQIVKTHAAIAVGSAFIPLPGADVAASAANVWTMYVRINKELNLPFGDNVIKSVAAGVVTNIGSAAAGMIVMGSALKLIPGIGSIGGAILMSTTIYAITIAAGVVYMKAVAHLLKSKDIAGISEADLRSATDKIVQNKASMDEVLREGKETYKRDKSVKK